MCSRAYSSSRALPLPPWRPKLQSGARRFSIPSVAGAVPATMLFTDIVGSTDWPSGSETRVAAARGDPPRGGSPRAPPVRRSRARYGRRRVLRRIRSACRGGSRRRSDRRGCRRARRLDPCGLACRRGRSHRREVRRDRRAYREQSDVCGGARRGLRVGHPPGSGRWIRPRVQRSGPAGAQGHPWRVAPVGAGARGDGCRS